MRKKSDFYGRKTRRNFLCKKFQTSHFCLKVPLSRKFMQNPTKAEKSVLSQKIHITIFDIKIAERAKRDVKTSISHSTSIRNSRSVIFLSHAVIRKNETNKI